MSTPLERENIILVAFDVLAPTREAAENVLHSAFDIGKLREEHGQIDSWWVAEDERYDRSDNDSAVFCDPGQQLASRNALRRLGLASGAGRGFDSGASPQEMAMAQISDQLAEIQALLEGNPWSQNPQPVSRQSPEPDAVILALEQAGAADDEAAQPHASYAQLTWSILCGTLTRLEERAKTVDLQADELHQALTMALSLLRSSDCPLPDTDTLDNLTLDSGDGPE